MKEYYLSKNKYIRLRIVKYYAYFRADISVNKYAFNGNVPCRYYEINFDCFSPYDYAEINELKTQQKEFINFLEDNYKETQDIWYIKILQKYKSIIGE